MHLNSSQDMGSQQMLVVAAAFVFAILLHRALGEIAHVPTSFQTFFQACFISSPGIYPPGVWANMMVSSECVIDLGHARVDAAFCPSQLQLFPPGQAVLDGNTSKDELGVG